MASVVYVGNRTHGAIKIVGKHGKYYVHALKEIQVPLTTSSDLKRPHWVWETTPYETWMYKPYDDKDVSLTQAAVFESVTTWRPNKVRKIP